ncbi:MAG: hypothetical protein ABF295_12175 [Flavobacteriaceae bacterium]
MTRLSLTFLAFILLLLGCTSDLEESEMLYPENTLPAPIEEMTEIEISKIDLVYGWVNNMQGDNGLLESAEDTNFVSLYDNALASMIFMARGDFLEAEMVFDFFHTRIDSELLNGNGGFHQFRTKDGGNIRRTWLGDNAWLLIALNNYQNLTQSNKYDRLAKELEIWIRSLQNDDGSLAGGYNQDGSPIGIITEGMITAFNAVPGYDDFHKKLLLYLQDERWDDNELLLLTQKEEPAYQYALDLHSLSFLILKNFPPSVLDLADRYRTTQRSTVTNIALEGYCFDDDNDVIWLEGTAQMALARAAAQQYETQSEIIEELEKNLIESNSFTESKGLPYTSNQGTSFGAVELWEHADLKPTLSSSIWYLFVKLSFNPFTAEKSKSIPITDQFWNPVM